MLQNPARQLKRSPSALQTRSCARIVRIARLPPDRYKRIMDDRYVVGASEEKPSFMTGATPEGIREHYERMDYMAVERFV